MNNNYYFIEAQGDDKNNYIANLKQPPFMVARVYKWRTSRDGAQAVKEYMLKFPFSVQIEGYNIVVAFSDTLTGTYIPHRFREELAEMANFYLTTKMEKAQSYYKHYKV